MIADILANFPADDIDDGELKIEDCKKKLYTLVNKGVLDTQEYAEYTNFIKNTGSVCNIKQIIDQTNKLAVSNESNEFKKSLGSAFEDLMKYDENDGLRINKNISYYMTRLDTINLTFEQKNAMKKMCEFLMDPMKTTFGLHGYAGSGKTTTVVEFVSYMLMNKYMKRISFTAPTNKAVNVIKGKFKIHLKRISEKLFEKKLEDTFNFEDELELLEQRGICIKFLTIHKLLMFQSDYSVTGDMIFIRDGKSGTMIPGFELVIIDECSMISMDMVDNIFEEVREIMNPRNKTKKIPKIIFSGDPAQLPPVNESESSIFCKTKTDLTFQSYVEKMSYKISNTVMSNSKSIMEHRYNLLLKDLGEMESVLLKKVVRSKLNYVTKVCNELRKWVNNERLPSLEKYKKVPGVHFYKNEQTIEKTQNQWFKHFMGSIKKEISCIIITWTNKQTDIYNETIRRHLFRGKNIQKFEVNDILMLSDFYGLDLGEEFVKQKLHTSEQIKVLSTKMCEIPIKTFQPLINSGLKNMKNGPKIQVKVKLLIDGLNDGFCKDVKFLCWILRVQKHGEESSHDMSIVVVDDAETVRYNGLKTESGKAIRIFAKQLLNQNRTCPKQIEKYVIKPLWKQWNKIFVEPFASVNYGYSITCHKAQGSSFNDVYVDVDDILLNTQRHREAKKCTYTAAARASNELFILI